MGEKGGFGDLWHTVLCLLDVSNGALFAMISSVSGSTRAFILLCHGSSVLANERGVTKWTGVSNITETESVESSGGDSVEAGTHVTEKSSPSLETFTLSFGQFSFSRFAIGHFLASVSSKTEWTVAADHSFGGMSTSSIQTSFSFTLGTFISECAFAFSIN